MTNFFKSFIKAIINILIVPVFLLSLAIVAIVGVFLLAYMFIKSLILFFTGKSLKDDLKEDIQAKKIKEAAIKATQASLEPSEPQQTNTTPPVIEQHSESTNIERSVTNNIYINTNGQPISEDLLKVLNGSLPKDNQPQLPLENKPLEIESSTIVDEEPNQSSTQALIDDFVHDDSKNIEDLDTEKEDVIEEYIPITNDDNLSSIYKKGDK